MAALLAGPRDRLAAGGSRAGTRSHHRWFLCNSDRTDRRVVEVLDFGRRWAELLHRNPSEEDHDMQRALRLTWVGKPHSAVALLGFALLLTPGAGAGGAEDQPKLVIK